MKEFYLEKQRDGSYVCKDEEAIVYRGLWKRDGNLRQLLLYNAFQDEIIALSYTKSGAFRLFRNNKPAAIIVRFQNHSGTLHPHKTNYAWQVNDITYTFYCGIDQGTINLAMYDGEELIAYVVKNRCVLKHFLYSVELCAVWMFLQEHLEQKNPICMEQEAFMYMLREGSRQW